MTNNKVYIAAFISLFIPTFIMKTQAWMWGATIDPLIGAFVSIFLGMLMAIVITVGFLE